VRLRRGQPRPSADATHPAPPQRSNALWALRIAFALALVATAGALWGACAPIPVE
jgi:hypothetical protein